MSLPIELSSIVGQSWRRRAACSFSADLTLWDTYVWDETPAEREGRYRLAKAVCASCPVRVECARSIDWELDDGIRAGELLPDRRNGIKRRTA